MVNVGVVTPRPQWTSPHGRIVSHGSCGSPEQLRAFIIFANYKELRCSIRA